MPRYPSDGACAALAAAGYVVVVLRYAGRPRPAEHRLFQRVNDVHGTPLLRGPQQLGTPWALPAASALLLSRGRITDALAAALALPLEKGLEVGTKKAPARPRPGVVTVARLRDDAPTEGPSQPSGHVAIAAAATWLAAPVLPRPVVTTLAASTAGVGYVRVRQGAHWPSDVAAGALLGVLVGAGSRAVAHRFSRLLLR